MAPPAIWLGHFAGTYGTVVMACGRWEPPASQLAPAVVLAGTAAAFVGLAGCQLASARRVNPSPPVPLDDDTPASRSEFLATTHLLLVVTSALGIGFVAFGTAAVGVCR
jgi:hypothetical protein